MGLSLNFKNAKAAKKPPMTKTSKIKRGKEEICFRINKTPAPTRR